MFIFCNADTKLQFHVSPGSLLAEAMHGEVPWVSAFAFPDPSTNLERKFRRCSKLDQEVGGEGRNKQLCTSNRHCESLLLHEASHEFKWVSVTGEQKAKKYFFKKKRRRGFFCSWFVKFHDDLGEIETLASSGDFELEGELHISWGVVVKASCIQAVNSLQELLALCQSPLLHNVVSPHGKKLQGNDVTCLQIIGLRGSCSHSSRYSISQPFTLHNPCFIYCC